MDSNVVEGTQHPNISKSNGISNIPTVTFGNPSRMTYGHALPSTCAHLWACLTRQHWHQTAHLRKRTHKKHQKALKTLKSIKKAPRSHKKKAESRAHLWTKGRGSHPRVPQQVFTTGPASKSQFPSLVQTTWKAPSSEPKPKS